MNPEAATPWASLRGQPFDLLLAIERALRDVRRDAPGASDATPDTATWTGLAFRLRDLWLVVPGDDVREVTGRPKLTRVPGSRSWLMGVANVRGSLLPVTDLGALFGYPPGPDSREQRVLVLNADGVPAGFLVDEVAGYRRFAPEDQRDDPPRHPGLAPWRLGAFHREGRDWQVLSLRKLARSDSFALAGA